MNQVEFCIECAKRIRRPFKTSSDIQIYQICMEGKRIDLAKMFNDKEVYELFKNSVWAEVYNFVRDNQELFSGID